MNIVALGVSVSFLLTAYDRAKEAEKEKSNTEVI
jgi:hypothetical protein